MWSDRATGDVRTGAWGSCLKSFLADAAAAGRIKDNLEPLAKFDRDFKRDCLFGLGFAVDSSDGLSTAKEEGTEGGGDIVESSWKCCSKKRELLGDVRGEAIDEAKDACDSLLLFDVFSFTNCSSVIPKVENAFEYRFWDSSNSSSSTRSALLGKGDMDADCLLLLFKLDTDPAYCRLLFKLDTDPVYESGREEVCEKEEDLRCIPIPSSDTTVAAGEKREEPRLGIDMDPPTGALFGGCIVVVIIIDSDSPSSDMVARWTDFVTTVREVETDVEAEEPGECEILLEGDPAL